MTYFFCMSFGSLCLPRNWSIAGTELFTIVLYDPFKIHGISSGDSSFISNIS